MPQRGWLPAACAAHAGLSPPRTASGGVGVEMGAAWVGLFATAHHSAFAGKGVIRAQCDHVTFPVAQAYQIGTP